MWDYLLKNTLIVQLDSKEVAIYSQHKKSIRVFIVK